MADKIEGADWSHWQGVVDCAKAYSKGLRFVGIKVSQGIGYKDDRAEVNNTNARANGILTFPYHFITTDAPTAQYNWFIKCIGNMEFDLAPALDYETYNPITLEPYTVMREGTFNTPKDYQGRVDYFDYWAQHLGLVTIPASSTVYSIATKLKGWRGHPVPTIYSNISTFNTKCLNTTIYNWSQFLCWLAQWNVAVPITPTAWKGKALYIWQDRVIRGAQEWGVQGDMDHDVWMDALPFPGVTPPPPITEKVSAEIYIRELSKNVKLLEV